MKIVDNVVDFTYSKEVEDNKNEVIDSLPKAKKFIFIWQEEGDGFYTFNHVSGGTMKGDFVFVGAWLQHLHLKEIFEREDEDES